MKHLFSRWLLMAALVLGATTVMAQKSVLDENFANGKPAGWETVFDFWKFQDGNANFQALVENGKDTLIAPEVSLAELDNKPSVALTYSNVANNGKLNTLKVLYRAASTDEWAELKTFDAAADQESWKDVLPEGLSKVQIALAGAYLGGAETRVYRLAIENKTEGTEAPANLRTENLTTTSVTLWWDACQSTQFVQYNVRVNTSKMTDMSVAGDVENRYGVLFTDEFLMLENLTPNTEYWLYVQYDCGDGDVSPWAEASFKTPCESIHAPFTEDFEGELSSCYTIIKNGSDAAVSSEYPHNSAKSFKSISEKGVANYLILPEFDGDVKNYQINFWAAALEGGDTYTRTITIGVCTEQNEASFTELTTLHLPVGRKWENITVSLDGYSGTGKYIAFKFGNANKENRIFVDDIKVEVASSCPKPMFVTISEITSTSAKIDWTKTGSETEWNIVISTQPLDDPEDGDFDEGKGEYGGKISAKPYIAQSLLPNTTYYVYLQAGCAQGEYTSAVEFKTSKEVSYPYFEDFSRLDPDKYTNNIYAVPDGWVMDSRCVNPDYSFDLPYNTYLPYVVTTQNHEVSAYVNASLYLRGTSQGANAYYSSIAMLPAMPKAVKDMTVTFWAMSTNGTHNVVVGVANTQTAGLAQGQQLGKNIIEVDKVEVPGTSTWAKYSVNLKAYNEGDGNQERDGRYITFYLQPGGIGTPSVYIDDITIEDTPDCAAVTGLSAVANGTSKANISWSDATSATSWNVKVSSTAIDPSTQNGDKVANKTVTSKSYTATGLSMGTTYYVYVSPACGDFWESTEVTTGVGLEVPYYNDFSDELVGAKAAPNRGPRNWTLGYTAGTSWTTATYVPYVDNTTTSSGGWYNKPADVSVPFLKLYNSTTSTQVYPYAIMPELLNASAKDLQITFYAYTSNTSTTATYAAKANQYYNVLKVGVVNNPTDINKDNGFSKVTEIKAIRCKTGRATEFFTVDLSSYTGSGKYIVFYQDTLKTNTSFIDNLTIAKKTDPWKVSDVAVSNITQTGAKVTWTEMGSATKWEVRVFDAEQEDPAAGEPAYSNANVTAQNVTATGLSHSKQYYAYVRSLQASGEGEWNSVSFWTETGNWSLPFTEDFEDYYATFSYRTLPNYYIILQADGTTLNSFTYHYVYELNGEKFVKQQSTSTAAYKVTTFALPPFDKPINTLQMTFRAHADATSSSTESAINTAIQQSPTEIGVLEENGTFVPVTTFSVSSNEWEEKYVNFQSYTGAGGRIAIRTDYNKKNATNAIRYDDIVVKEIPECGRITTVEVTDINITTATLSWSNVKTETKWNLKVSTKALEDPDVATADVFSGQLNVTTKALTSLVGNTDYYVYIQTVDEDKNCVGDWSSATIFRTLCDLQSLPYVENFNSYQLYGAGYIPDCSTLSGDDANHSYITTRAANDGTRMLQLRQATKDHNNYFAFPALDIEDVKLLQLTMFVNPGGTTTTNYYYYEVGVMTDPNDPTTFVSVKLDSVQGAAATVFNEKKYTFEGYKGDEDGKYGTFIALKPLEYKNPTKPTTYYAGYVYIDDVTIDFIPTCAKPTGVTSSSIDIDEVTLTWATDDETANHRVRVFADADANPETDEFVAEKVVAANTATLDGLNGNTVYYAFVRKECGGEDGNSKWSLAYSFCTDCPETTPMPYVETFENCTVSQTPNCWSSICLTSTTGGKATVVANGTMNYAFESEKAMSVNYTHSQSGSSSYTRSSGAAVTPALNIENLKDVLVYFDIKAGTAGRSMKIEAVSDDTPNAEAIHITTLENVSTTWTKVYIKLADYYTSAQSYNRLRFVPLLPSSATISSTFYIDNITFTTNLNEVLPVTALTPKKVTTNSLTFSFEEKTPGIEHWQTAYVAKGGDIADATIKDIDTTTVTVSGLNINSSYDIYVRSKVDGSAWVGPLVMTTSATVPATIPYETGFEDETDNALWQSHNLTAANKPYPNSFIIGDAAKCDATGSKALFVSDNDADYQYTGTVSYGYATRTIFIEEVGSYWFSIKAKVPGNAKADKDGDCMYAHLVPAGTTFSAGSIKLLNGSTRNYSSTSDGSNCYALAGKVTHETDWKIYSRQLDITEPGEYMIAIAWTNNTTPTPGKPVAVDSVSVMEYLCTDVSAITMNAQDAHSASFKWFAGKSKNFEYIVSRFAKLGNPKSIDEADKVAAGILTEGPQISINGLKANTNYSLYVRTICEDGYTDWVEYDFSTLCESESLPYTEAFVETPACWILNNATVTTRTQKDGEKEEKWNCLQLNNSGIAILPQLNVALNKVNIEVAAFNGQAFGAVSIGVIENVLDASTFVELANLAPAEKQISSADPFVLAFQSKMLNLYSGSAKHIALRNVSGNTIYVKYVKLTELPDCIQPYQVEITNIAEDAATINWLAGTEEAWEIQVNNDEPIAVTENPYRLTGLEQGTIYNIAVRAICDAEHKSEWSVSAKFQTTCGINPLPLFEDFSGLVAANKRATLTCWSNMATNQPIEQVFSGAVSPYEPASSVYYTYMWIANYLSQFGDEHQLLFFGSTLLSDGPKYRWMITPQYAIEGNATLSFDVRHTDNKNCAAKPEGRFFVAISTDNGATWKKDDATLIEGIDSVYTTKSVSLNKFAGQNIRVAFYMENLGGETTTKGSGLFTLLDNIRMNCTDTYPYADNACQGYDYEGYGFSIKAEDLPLAGEDSTYYRFAANEENGCDSTIALTITTRTATPIETIYDTICQGDVYEFGPYELTESNPEGQPYFLNGENEFGCDKPVYLYLHVKPRVISDVVVAIDNSLLPYQVDEFYTVPADAPIGETFEEIIQTSETECSFNKYIVTISQCLMPVEFEDAICENQTSYEGYGFAIDAAELPAAGESKPFNRTAKDEVGCDSIITLTLAVIKNDTVDHLPAYEIKLSELPFVVDGVELLPAGTPVGDYNIVIPAENDACSYDRYFYSIIEDLDGLIYVTDGLTDVIIYDALGHKVAVAVDSSELKALDLPSGVYLIRTTTQNGNAFCGKFIVK